MEYIDILLNLLILLMMVIIIVLELRAGKNNKKNEGFLEELSELDKKMLFLEKSIDSISQALRNELSLIRTESNQQSRQNREETNSNLKQFQDSLLERMSDIAILQNKQIDSFSRQLHNLSLSNEERLSKLTTSNEQKMEAMRQTIESKIQLLQEDNNRKLEEMRATVDEKLNATLEQRLGESFKLVSDRLEQVHKGLGEMQNLASGVGDLKKVLSNVKTRGIWGEMQLGNILEQVLSPEQYASNIATRKRSNERVEYAIRLPGKNSDDAEVWLPIDAKFPQEDYLRLVEASENGDRLAAEEAGKHLENRIKLEARHIQEKYLDPPNTTDFGIMFLPTESLYAEVLRRPGLISVLQRDYRVIITGPTTMVALLNSLSVGFRTMAIEKRSSEVWKLLGAVKTEFSKFALILEKTKKKLDEASNSIDTASRKTRNIERKLKQVQELPEHESQTILNNKEEELKNISHADEII